MPNTVDNNQRPVVTRGTGHVAVSIEPDWCLEPGKVEPTPFHNCVRIEKLGAARSITVTVAGWHVCLSPTQWGPPSDPYHRGISIRSDGNRGAAQALTFSKDVNVEGKPVVRLDDFTLHNRGPKGFNTYGHVVTGQAHRRHLDVQAASEHLVKHAASGPQKACAKRTREAIEAGGVTLRRPPARADGDVYAADYGDSLGHAGYQPVADETSIDDYEALTSDN